MKTALTRLNGSQLNGNNIKVIEEAFHGMASPEIEPEEVEQVVNIGMEQY